MPTFVCRIVPGLAALFVAGMALAAPNGGLELQRSESTEQPGTPAVTCPSTYEVAGADVAVAATSANEVEPDMVWNGSRYGVVWTDQGSSPQVRFRLLFGSGAPSGSVVGLGSGRRPSIIWTGQRFAIVYEEPGGGIRVRLVSGNGSTVGGVAQVSPDGFRPAIAWNGSEYGVVWHDSSVALHFGRVNSSGNPVPNSTVTIPGAVGINPALASDGSGFGLAWSDTTGGLNSDEVTFVRLDAAGGLASSLEVLSNPGPHFVETIFPISLVWQGSEYGIVWNEDSGIFFARIDAAGQRIGSNVPMGGFITPDLVWNGTEYGASWNDIRNNNNGEVFFGRIAQDGTRIGTDFPVSNHESGARSALAWNGSEYGLIFADYRGGSSDVFFNRLVCAACSDGDGDGFTDCEECDDSDPLVFPGAPQICDGVNNDCDDAQWPLPPAVEVDDDGDGWIDCAGDCDDTDDTVYPGAQQRCDGINNVCDDPNWPDAPADELDADGDGYPTCAGDCDDSSAAAFPGAMEVCNGIDDDCDGLIDEVLSSVDRDGDGVADLCDNCIARYNADQLDIDFDSVGNACDGCMFIPTDTQDDLDGDGVGDPCDNCPASYNPEQSDLDGDMLGDVCDSEPTPPGGHCNGNANGNGNGDGNGNGNCGNGNGNRDDQ